MMIAETPHPFSAFPANPSIFGIGSAQIGLNTKRFFAESSETPRVALKLIGFNSFSNEAPWSIALLNVYDA